MKTKQSKKLPLADKLVLFIFTVLSVSGINLHLASKGDMGQLIWGLGQQSWNILHILSAMLTMAFISCISISTGIGTRAFSKDPVHSRSCGYPCATSIHRCDPDK